MSIAKTYTAQVAGIRGTIITIEADISNGLHSFSIVGMGDRAVEESRERIAAAIKNSGYISPKQKNQKVIVSLAPADLRKEGPVFELGMALAYLTAAGEIRFDPEGKLFLGELSLEGKIRPVSGILAMIQAAKKEKFEEIYLPTENAREAALIAGVATYPAGSLAEVISHLCGKRKIKSQPATKIASHERLPRENCYDFQKIFGQENAKRALEIAAAGRHAVVMYGPPGSGKTMLAKALRTVLPQLSYADALEVTTIHSVAGILKKEIMTEAPFRNPHHTSSYASLVGGGGNMHLGEITLAHKGILFMDEFPEFDRRVIDSLRQPLEEKEITITRAKGSITYPADCMFVAAMNPCPCGNLDNHDQARKCICTDNDIMRYRKKISGPIADRIDIWIPILKVNARSMAGGKFTAESVESSAAICGRILRGLEFKKKRSSEDPNLSPEAQKTLILFSEKMNLSGRGYHRALRVARTIADLAQSEEIKKSHILEALQYRQRSF